MNHPTKVLLFNPRAAKVNYRIPNSILAIASSIHGQWDYALVDGNLESDPLNCLCRYLDSGEFGYFGCTVMPGPQLQQAIPFTQHIRLHYPHIKIIWGGYFAANQYRTVMQSGQVDYIVKGPGEQTFPALLNAIESGQPVDAIQNLVFRRRQEIMVTPTAPLPDLDALPPLPYETLNRFYPISRYLGKTFLGQRTAAYHSSYGCPFTCSFCAVVPIYNARWRGKSAANIYKDIQYLKEAHNADAVEFHDNNFFVSEKRAVEFARLVKADGLNWWGEARIDTMSKYADASLAQIRESGCRMIFFGAETGNDAVLKQMDKGGTQSGQQICEFAARLAKFDIIPEYSFVLGTPAATSEAVMRQIDFDIAFIKTIKEINPKTEIIIYIYSPTPTEGSELYLAAQQAGFTFPAALDDWLSPAWQNFDLRKNPLTPWLTPAMVDKIHDFETVLNARYPTLSDTKLTPFQRRTMYWLSGLRYEYNRFAHPYELRLLQSRWLRYRQPETEGF